MKNLNKKVGIVLATALFLAPTLSYAGEMEMTNNTQSYNVGSDYYAQFKQEFYEQLVKGDFSAIDKKIQGYRGDVQFLLDNPESEYYNNLSIYKEKLATLERLKSHFTNIAKQKEEHLNNNTEKKEELKKNAEQKKEELKKLAEKKKEELKKISDEKKVEWETKKEDMKQKVEETKQNFKIIKQDIKAKYKEIFAKKLQGKLDNFSTEKLKKVLINIDTAIEKYSANTKLTAEQKEKFIAQLNAVKEIIQEKLNDIDEMINLEELLSE